LVSDLGWSPELAFPTRRPTVLEQVIDEHRTVRYETIVSYGHQITNKRMRLDPASLADNRSTLNFNKWADERVISNRTTVEVDGLDHGHIVTESDVDYTDVPELGFCHKSLS
jgi:hypothetical protein